MDRKICQEGHSLALNRVFCSHPILMIDSFQLVYMTDCIGKGIVFPPVSLLVFMGRVVQLVLNLTCKSEVLGSIPDLATYFRFSFR